MEEEKIEESREGDKKKQKTGSVGSEILSWVLWIGGCVLVAVLLRTFIVANAVIPTGSMEDTVETGDRLFGLKCAYTFSDPERFDIIMFYEPIGGELYLKRIIGLPGETVEIRDGEVYIDGSDEPLDDSFIKEEWTVYNDGMTFTVPEDCYFVLGDNRNDSFDSRYWPDEALREGLASNAEEAEKFRYVTRDSIYGKAYLVYWKKIRWLY